MTIETRALGFALTGAILRHVEARVRAALAPVARRVAGVTARVGDVNAGRGGVDKRCRLVAGVRRRRGVVVAEATHADLYAAVDAAAGRLRRAAARAVRRTSRAASGRARGGAPGRSS